MEASLSLPQVSSIKDLHKQFLKCPILAGKLIIVDENVSMEYHLTKVFELLYLQNSGWKAYISLKSM